MIAWMVDTLSRSELQYTNAEIRTLQCSFVLNPVSDADVICFVSEFSCAGLHGCESGRDADMFDADRHIYWDVKVSPIRRGNKARVPFL